MANFEETIDKELDKELIASEFEGDSFENLETASEDLNEEEDY